MHRALLALLTITTGCTHHRNHVSIREVVGDEVTIETRDRRELTATGDVTPQGIVFRDPAGQVISSDRIASVTRVSRAGGAVEGLGLGALGGALLGATLGYASGDDECTGFCILQYTAGEKAVMGGIAVGGLGGLLGLVIGAAYGSHHVYSFGSEQLRITPSGPPGSVAGATVVF